MRLFSLLLMLTIGSAAAAEPQELATAANAILCLSPEHLVQAHSDRNAAGQGRLRNIGCLRSPAGVPATLLSGDSASTWSVRFRPEGMPDGITLWGRPSAFTLPDGTPLRSLRAER